jgi:predicted Zn-dependent peptidase
VFLVGQPSPVNVYHPDLLPLKLLNVICFHSLGSRIYQLREQTGLFYSAFGALAARASKETGYDFAGAIVSPDKCDEAEKLICATIDRVGAKGIDERELAAARQIHLKGLIDLVADSGTIASLLCRIDALNLGFDHYEKELARVQGLDLAELNRVAAKYCTTGRLARVRVGRVG